MNMRLILAFIMVLSMMPASATAADIIIRPTVMVEYATEPAYLMPGDTGTVTVTLKNAAELYSYYSQPQDKEFDLTAQVLEASLKGDSEIQVMTSSYNDVGLLGPGDSIDFTYAIKADKNAADGIHFLEFVFVGGGDMYNVKWKVPVTIDTSGIRLIDSEVSGPSDFIVMDVANTRPNTVNAVTIIPTTDNVEYQPAQYFIGTMDSDEMFTIQFDIRPEDEIKQIGFRVQFKNGNNWHESDIHYVNVNNSKPVISVQRGSNPLLAIALVGGSLLIIVAIFVIMRKRRSRELT